MATYSVLRELADSWFLLAMFGFFVLVVLYTFRPGSRRLHRDIAEIPFRNEAAPKGEADGNEKE
jgi:cytochrome c oxidase cbb3-type subunit 4